MARRRKTTRYKTRKSARSNPRGILSITHKGYGFVKTAEGEFFIPQSGLLYAMDGDLVEIIPRKKNQTKNNSSHDRPEARIVSVVTRASNVLIGRYEIAEPFGIVVPEDQHIHYDVFTMAADNPDVRDGDIVKVRMCTFPSKKEAATGIIEEVIGHEDESTLDSALIIARYELETKFSAAAISQADEAQIDVAGALVEGYKDIRDRFVFTVDPTDAKDFDDALSLSKTESGYRLGVHIADVSYYVPWNSSIDYDARRRATSVYLVDRVIPMLPPALSENICSLRPNEPRRSLTIDIYLNDKAEVQSINPYFAIIESKARLTYDQALSFIEGNTQAVKDIPLKDKLASLIPCLSNLCQKLYEKRKIQGSLDFETKEARVRLDNQGLPVGVDIRKKNLATSMVEESMILANVCVAQYLRNRNLPCIYRIHENPEYDALSELGFILQDLKDYKEFNVSAISVGNPKELQKLLKFSKGRPEEALINYLLLRCMKRACYKDYCDRHYGLAEDAYCHFTSPIRRYPDLVVHRMLRAHLMGKTGTYEQQKQSCAWIAEHSSKMERIAEAASRESQELKLVEYMQAYCGKSFVGMISGVTSHGLYISLDNTAEGFLPIRFLGEEYFIYDGLRNTLTGDETGEVFCLGKKINVRLVSADPRQRKLEFRYEE